MSPTRTRPLRELLRVEPGAPFHLAGVDPDATYGRTREGAAEQLQAGLDRLSALQDRLWAEARHPVLVVLQGIDTAGKGGTLKHVMSAFQPAGCTVTSFKVPTTSELAHDYLWRVHARTPGKGEIGIFDRSHYEDVLIVRVHDIVPKAVWSKRYRQINEFERILTDEGTTIVKFFLWISRVEQRERLQARLDEPDKRWKFRLGDLEERKRWDDYVAAFDEALERCSTESAPWYVIPANKKWFRNLAVAEILGDTIEDLKPHYPDPPEDLTGVVVE
ncbi:MAG TPA: polyphosphate kinase 2 family protein [Candidatus Limnocylindrales bacterium]